MSTVSANLSSVNRRLIPQLSLERWIFWVTTGLLALAILYPATMAVFAAFTENGKLSLGGFQRIFATPLILREIRTTIIFAAGATLCASVIGISLAWINARTDVPGRRFIEALCIVPMFMSAFVGAYAWRLILVPRAGMLSRTLTNWGWPPELLPDIYSLTSMIVIQSLFYSPFMYLYTVASFRQMDPSLEEVARIHGAGQWKTLWHITLSVNGPALLSGMVLIFVLSIGTLEVPLSLGITGGNYVLSTRIFTLMHEYPRDTSMAAALGFMAIFIAGSGIWIQRRILGKRQFTTITGKGYRARRIVLGKWRWIAFGIAFSYILAAVIAPVLVLLLIGLQKFWGGSFMLDLFTLDNFHSVLFEYDVTRRAILNSLVACSAGATIAVALATILSQAGPGRGESLIGFLVILPMAIPGVVFGLAVLFAYVHTPLYRTLWVIVIAYVTGNLYVPYRTVYSVRLSIHSELEQSARIHGATWLKATYKILLPLLKPGIVSAWLMSFVIFIREFSCVMFLYRHGTEVMSVVFWLLMERHSARLAAFMFFQTTLLLFIMVIYQRVAYRGSGGVRM